MLRLRLRDSRTARSSSTPSTRTQHTEAEADDEVEEAADGHVVRRLTHLNSDETKNKSELGPRAVEAYIPLNATGPDQRVIGVLETYIPYAPIGASFAASNQAMEILIALGLVALWLALSGITWSVTRRIRKGAATNAHMALHDILTGLPNRALFGRPRRARDRGGPALRANPSASRSSTSIDSKK